MADVNNKIRLQIVTQLDAAGIKATKEQVDQLEAGLRKVSNSAGGSSEKFGALEKSLGKLPGRLGEVAGKLGGLAGQATMVVGAFSMGVEIGNKICEVATKWGLMADPIAEIKKETAEYDKWLKKVKEDLAEVTAEELKRFDVASAAADKSIKKIDEQTAAYFRQAASLKGLKDAGDSAEMQQLQRMKFEDMKSYADAGYTEAAEQIGRYYDVLEQELRSKQEIAAFDRESIKLDKEQQKNEEAYAVAAERVVDAKAAQDRADAALAEHRRARGIGGYAAYDNEADATKDDELEKVANRAAKDVEKAEEVLRKRGEKLDTVDADVLARQMQRANLNASGRLAVDRAAQAYDDYVMQNGNPLNAQIDPAWQKELLQKTIDADQTQKDLLQEVRAFGDRLEKLLEMK